MRDNRRAGVHQDEAASAIRGLDHAALNTGLTKGCRLLITRDTSDRYGSTKQRCIGVGGDATAWHDGWQDGAGNIEKFKQLVIPAQRMHIEQHGA